MRTITIRIELPVPETKFPYPDEVALTIAKNNVEDALKQEGIEFKTTVFFIQTTR